MRKFLFSLMLLNLLNIATAQQDSLNQNQPVDTGEVFTIVQEMPILLSCDSLDATHDEKKSCSDKNLLEYFSKNLRYPKAAKEAGVESTVVVRFIVNTDGSVGDVQVIKAGHPTLADEALRLINEMPAWRPGYQRGQAVRVQFILPFRIHLQ